jgi:hypothetical protein
MCQACCVVVCLCLRMVTQGLKIRLNLPRNLAFALCVRSVDVLFCVEIASFVARILKVCVCMCVWFQDRFCLPLCNIWNRCTRVGFHIVHCCHQSIMFECKNFVCYCFFFEVLLDSSVDWSNFYQGLYACICACVYVFVCVCVFQDFEFSKVYVCDDELS